jgi:catechol 2,3-dioxygenase-like lactoylglutathione lyase family enzyme
MPTVLGQLGIGVSNLDRSVTFYTKTLSIGLAPTATFDTPDFIETVLAFPKGKQPTGSEIALMQYKDGVVPKKQQGKLMFYVDDVEEVMGRCKQGGAEVYSDFGEGEGIVEHVGIVLDPDGFLVEFLPMMFLMAAQGSSKL